MPAPPTGEVPLRPFPSDSVPPCSGLPDTGRHDICTSSQTTPRARQRRVPDALPTPVRDRGTRGLSPTQRDTEGAEGSEEAEKELRHCCNGSGGEGEVGFVGLRTAGGGGGGDTAGGRAGGGCAGCVVIRGSAPFPSTSSEPSVSSCGKVGIAGQATLQGIHGVTAGEGGGGGGGGGGDTAGERRAGGARGAS
jgi:hypothetical protein